MRSPEPSLFSPYENAFLPAETLSSYAFSLCGGPCAGLFRIESGEMLKGLVRCCINASIPYRVLGGMTNILVSDDGYDGVILLNRKGSVSHTFGKDGSILLSDLIGTPYAADPEELFTEALLKEQIRKVLATLTPRERRILELRFGLNDEDRHTLEEVSRIYGISRERVRQIQAKAIRKLRRPACTEMLKDFLN